MKKLLTDALISGTSIEKGRLNIFDSKFSGLFIQIFPNRKVFRYKTRDRQTRRQVYHNLGDYPDTSIDEARAKAAVLTAKGREKTEKTLAQALAGHLKIQEAKHRKPRTISDTKYYVEHYCKQWLDTPLKDFTRKTAEEISLSITSTPGQHHTTRLTTRNILIRYLRGIFNSAIQKDSKLVNPFSKPEKLGLLTATAPRRVDSLYTSLPAVISVANILLIINTDFKNELQKVRDNAALALFLLLTGVRIGDAKQLTYGDLMPSKTFILRDTKNRSTYELPLPELYEDLAYWMPPDKTTDADVAELRKTKIFPHHDIRTVLEKVHVKILESSIFKDMWASRETHRLRPHDLRRLYTSIATSTLLNTDIIDLLTCRRPGSIRAKFYVDGSFDIEELRRASKMVTSKILDTNNNFVDTIPCTIFPKKVILSSTKKFKFPFE